MPVLCLLGPGPLMGTLRVRVQGAQGVQGRGPQGLGSNGSHYLTYAEHGSQKSYLPEPTILRYGVVHKGNSKRGPDTVDATLSWAGR
jgi:hypothetical protein